MKLFIWYFWSSRDLAADCQTCPDMLSDIGATSGPTASVFFFLVYKTKSFSMFQQLVTLSSAVSPGIILQVTQDVGLTAKRLKSNEVGREKMAH